MALIDSFNLLFSSYNKFLNQNFKTERFSDLSLNSYQYIVTIYDSNEITTTKLSELLGLKKASVTQMLQNLEEKGYVIKEPNKDDKRSSIIKLTEKGQSLIRDEESIFIQFETNMQKLLTEDELIQLDHLLYKLSRGIADDN